MTLPRRDLGQIDPAGEGRWYVRLSAGRDPITGARRRPRKTVHGTRKDAERALAEMLAEVGTGPAAGSAATLGVYLKARYLPWVEDRIGDGIRRATFETYSHELLVLAKPLHDVRLDRLDPWAVERWLKALKAQGLSGNSRGQAYGSLRRALRKAVRWQMIPFDVTDRVDRPSGDDYEPKILTLDEGIGLLRHFRGHRLDAMVHLALGGGLRRSENLGLRWENVLDDSVMIEQGWHGARLGIEDPKSRTSRRRVYLPSWALGSLDRHRPERPDAGWVFTETGARPWDPNAVTNAFREHALKVGIAMPLKDLRHSCGTLLLEAGEELLIVSQILGHSDTLITQKKYVKPRDQMRKAAAGRLEAMGG